ncbi:hypothetical protein MAPG_04097 [Magnaporthiopsis poae ATCC 64411]|uniref:SnoaL-like domain-containing protein n=1 Tax=Magnaporthiopsis poae (strain ATCC 64411 / 73-15) TaxID=644358 RepID=A0A0C4DVT6_MAGP6|nr:hypothetical protein MAPG_04097 [Magnaporthiopsis poae ATCC 64411]
MRAPASLVLALAALTPLGALAAPAVPVVGARRPGALSPRQRHGQVLREERYVADRGRGPSSVDNPRQRQVKFCEKSATEPTEAETKARFDKFADAFLVKKDLVEAFAYIAPEYINHNPAAKNGAQAAFDLLSPIWPSQRITVIRTLFKGNQGWLNYRNSFGTIVDRYRWEKGCIVEHVSLEISFDLESKARFER